MEHPVFDEMWIDLVEGTLSDDEARPLREHLGTCEACAAAYRRLDAVHRLSTRIGRESATDTKRIPAAVADRILANARAEAKPRRRRPRWGAVAAIAAIAVAVLLVVRVRAQRETARDAALVHGALEMLAATADVRGRADPIAKAAASTEQRWRDGALRVRSASIRCPGEGENVAALVTSTGVVALLAIRTGDATDVHMYGDDGMETAAARVIGGVHAPYLLAPLPQAGARTALENPACRSAPLRRP